MLAFLDWPVNNEVILRLRNSPFATKVSCGATELLGAYDICPERLKGGEVRPKR
jgi:hypothetical protein